MMKKWLKLMIVVGVMLFPLASVQAAKPVHWLTALKNANASAARSSFLADIGIFSSYNLKREIARENEKKKLEQFYKYYFDKDAFDLDKFKANYEDISDAMHTNPLLKDYMLTVTNFVDLHNLSWQEAALIVKFFNGKVPASKAQKFEEVILVTLNYKGADLWFVFNPQYKLVTFIYNDPADFRAVEGVEGKWTPLSVK